MIAIVTGSNRGIGKEVVHQLAEKGHEVILTSRNAEKGQEVVDELGRSNIHYHQLDVTSQNSIDQLVSFISRQFGRLDILVNNAGINYDTWQKATEADMVNVKETLETNLIGAWRMVVAFIPLMRKNGYGRIVNVSSGSGAIQGMGAGTPAYSVSKAAMNVMTIKLAAELKGSGILVNAICPGWVRTDMGGAGAPRSVEQGAAGIIWAAELPSNGPSGGFFRDGKKIDF